MKFAFEGELIESRIELVIEGRSRGFWCTWSKIPCIEVISIDHFGWL